MRPMLSTLCPSQSEPILIVGEKLLKPALRLMSDYRLRVDEIKGDVVVTSLHPVARICPSEERKIRKFI
jgi:hypothetical protein